MRLSGSYEKLILDAELSQLMTQSMAPMIVDEDTLGFDAIKEVGPGGHFFGSAHTLERYENAFYHPLLTESRTYETWAEQGKETAEHRANKLWKQMLSEYEKPSMDSGVEDELKDFVARRKREILKKNTA